MFRGSPPEVLSKKGALHTWSKLTGSQPCRSAAPTKPICNVIELTPMYVCIPENPHHTCKIPLFKRMPLGTVAVCGMECVDLIFDTIKILGTHFSYNEKLKEERNFWNIQHVLRLWKLWNLTYLRRTNTSLKNIGYTKNYFSSLSYTNTELHSYWNIKMQQTLLWVNSTSKIWHNALCNDYKDGRLKNVDIWNKNCKSLVLLDKKIIWWLISWWKIIPHHLISKTFSTSFIFHSNLIIKKKLIHLKHIIPIFL